MPSYLLCEDGDYLLQEDSGRIILEDGNVDATGAFIRVAEDHLRIVDGADPLALGIGSTPGEGLAVGSTQDEGLTVADADDTGRPDARSAGDDTSNVRKAEDRLRIVDGADPLALSVESTSGEGLDVSDADDSGQPEGRDADERVPKITRAMEI